MHAWLWALQGCNLGFIEASIYASKHIDFNMQDKRGCLLSNCGIFEAFKVYSSMPIPEKQITARIQQLKCQILNSTGVNQSRVQHEY